MNRVYLKKINHDQYIINDILDDKKLGKIEIKEDQLLYDFKNKVKDSPGTLKQEVGILLNRYDSSLLDFYTKKIKKYNTNWLNKSNNSLPEVPELPIYMLSCRLKNCGIDMFNRPVLLHPAAKKAWKKMKASAELADIDIQIISAYRDLNYQQNLIQNKINKGLDLAHILTINTLPGYSEHHTGCAIDIGSKNHAILEDIFDQSPAFDWLTNHAHEYGFYMTYPKNNHLGMIYEPWHWCYHGKKPISS